MKLPSSSATDLHKANIEHINTSISPCEAMLESRSMSILKEIYKTDISLMSLCQGREKGLLWPDAGKAKRISRGSQVPNQQ